MTLKPVPGVVDRGRVDLPADGWPALFQTFECPYNPYDTRFPPPMHRHVHLVPKNFK